MRLIASDFITHHRPTPCDLRVWLRHRGEPERDASEFEEVVHRLGERHEREHLATLGERADFSGLPEDERIKKTLEAIAAIVAWAHQTSSSKADFVVASRLASMSSMGLFAPIVEVDMKSAPLMWTEAAVETIRSAIAMRRSCSTARAAPFPP